MNGCGPCCDGGARSLGIGGGERGGEERLSAEGGFEWTTEEQERVTFRHQMAIERGKDGGE